MRVPGVSLLVLSMFLLIRLLGVGKPWGSRQVDLGWGELTGSGSGSGELPSGLRHDWLDQDLPGLGFLIPVCRVA